jgi:arsenite-transporting ATPase
LRFFVGKGGVGKTTVSAAYAVRSVVQHPRNRVLLISTDPAHSMGDIFGLKFGSDPSRVRLPWPGQLLVWEVDAEKQFRAFLGQHRENMLHLVESGTIFSREEIAPLLDTTLPGMAEVAALLAIQDALESRRYDEIVVDTAPFGHTLRLFAMPEHFAQFLNFLDVAASRDRVLAEHFGGSARPSFPFLDQWHAMVQSVLEALTRNARITLVTTPEKFALQESVRASRELAEAAGGLIISEIVLNRLVPRTSQCGICRTRFESGRAAVSFLKRNFVRVPIRAGHDTGTPMLGAAGLLAFGQHVFGGKAFRHQAQPPAASELRFKPRQWPRLTTPLSLTVGKGGVGKTTVSAAMAFAQRARDPRRTITICSADPAPSLDDVFQQPVGDRSRPVLGDAGFQAMELDSVVAFRHWAAEMKERISGALATETAGVHLDLSFERQLFSALLDVVPPGVDEVFAIFRILDLLASRAKRVVIDMAPTGHALELLRMPERILLWSRLLLKSLAAHRKLALARDVAVEIARVSQRVRKLASLLKNEKGARVWPVMLPEPMPDRETARLLSTLRALGTHPAPLFVNRVLFADDVRGCRRCARARRWQMATLAALRKRQRGREIFVIRNFPDEIAGARALRSFTRELWQVA